MENRSDGKHQSDIENSSDVPNVSSNSLRDASLEKDLFDDDEFNQLDKSLLDLLDNPYGPQQDALHLRKSNQYDGFDNNAGDSWIYPTNYPMRQYQFNITKAALFKNTLVVLPTGLGKTFIAAVVMYNIYRWYPTGKVIFMAPTRPLVSQQIEACYHIMGIPKSDTAEITGKQQRKNRFSIWQSKRVFYATPQVVMADLKNPEQGFPAEKVRLIVVDEAHKAKGRYAYTEVLKTIIERNRHFRVLALSATPGRTLEDVGEVIRNLLISHIEVRWDNSIDVKPYTFRRDVRTIVIPLSSTIQQIREQLLMLVDPYLRRLLEAKVFSRYPNVLSPGLFIMEQKRYRTNALMQRHPNHSNIISDFSVCISMYHALSLLVRHGIRAFLNYFTDGGGGAAQQNHQEKYFVAMDPQIKTFLYQLREQYYPSDGDVSCLTGNDDVDFGHPKYRLLEKQLMTFFKEQPDSKAIVFCEYRDSVAMIQRILSQNEPLIRARCIVGQGGTTGIRAVTQHEQIAAMRQFRTGAVNTLIATCVAEEGIDVGEVDLIVCFDIAKNPTRFVQRIGRTGRQRIGRVLMLVTEGEEHDTLKQVMVSKDKINQQLAKSKDIMRVLYRHSPNLVPCEFAPKCVEMFIKIPEESAKDRASDHGTESSDDSPVAESGRRSKRKRTRTSMAQNSTSVKKSPQKRRKIATSNVPQDVRQFFRRQQHGQEDDLDASESELFSAKSPNISRTDDHVPDRSSKKPAIPIDQSLRMGLSDVEAAIAKRVQPLVRHYDMLRRQKFINRQQLMDIPTMRQILARKLHPTVSEQLLRLLPDSPSKSSAPSEPCADDTLDFPQLVPYEKPRRSDQTGRESPAQDTVECAPGRSNSNANDLTTVLNQASAKNPSLSGCKKSFVSAKKARKKHLTSLDPANSPLLRAFNRSVKKRPNSDTIRTPIVTGDARELEKRTQSQNVLEFFKMESLEDIFADDDSDDMNIASTSAGRNGCDTPVARRSNEKLNRKATLMVKKLFDAPENEHEANKSFNDIRAMESDVMFDEQPEDVVVQPNATAVERVADGGSKPSTSSFPMCSIQPSISATRASVVSSKTINLGMPGSIFDSDSDEELYFFATNSPQLPDAPKPPVPSAVSSGISGSSANFRTKVNFARLHSYAAKRTRSPVEDGVSESLPFASCQSRPSATSDETTELQPCEVRDQHSSPIFDIPGDGGDGLDESVVRVRTRRSGRNRIECSTDDSMDSCEENDTLVQNEANVCSKYANAAESDDNEFFSVPSRAPKRTHRNRPEGVQSSPSLLTRMQKCNMRPRVRPARRAVADFFHSQAAASGDEHSDDADVGAVDETESFLSFVAVETDSGEEPNGVDIRAVYLQSVRSPAGRGRFKIPALKARPGSTVLSDVEEDRGSLANTQYGDEDCSFINDTVIQVDSELTELELAELRLRERRKQPKKKRRRKILVRPSSDSE
ncbi:Fanconi anemia group M protein homolog [Anopheles nili]|uniref:Fanconi anemia group M protein homolog n=1 Tax=Anopheles nili TaxID=185578 RepID=UPI00237C426E|nr:Fanconi anemia group M protein homolog [Anopheles nili]